MRHQKHLVIELKLVQDEHFFKHAMCSFRKFYCVTICVSNAVMTSIKMNKNLKETIIKLR